MIARFSTFSLIVVRMISDLRETGKIWSNLKIRYFSYLGVKVSKIDSWIGMNLNAF
jgi:hypothetical protein